jgi:hypothetical protein
MKIVLFLYDNFTSIINYLLNKFAYFVRLNVVSLQINPQYKLNKFLLLVLFICIISSIIFRSNIINIELLYNNNNIINIIIGLLIILSTIYSLKLIFDILNRGMYALKIIPEFIKMYNNKELNIKSIMNIYYIQSIFFILLSNWILFIILSKLRLFINDIDLFIMTFGVIGSIIIFSLKSNKEFNLDINNYKVYSI